MQTHRRPLSDRLAAFPRLGLATLPTPLEPMKRLTAHLGGPRLWVKREDATGLGFGGNKLRKLDYVLHEAVSSGADTIVSGGVVQSNSQRQVAAAAAKLGLACHLAVYHGRLEPPTPEYKTSGNAFLNRLFGAHLHDVPFDEASVEVVAGHAGPAYGVPHEATIEAIRLAGQLEALPLDPVYSGKGLAGLIALIRHGRWRKDENVIFLHTGGAPALFAYQSALGI